MKRKNLAEGKIINGVQDFAKVFSSLSVDQKTKVMKNIFKTIETGKGPDGKLVTPEQMITLNGMKSWAMINLMVGEELCPADMIETYINNLKKATL